MWNYLNPNFGHSHGFSKFLVADRGDYLFRWSSLLRNIFLLRFPKTNLIVLVSFFLIFWLSMVFKVLASPIVGGALYKDLCCVFCVLCELYLWFLFYRIDFPEFSLFQRCSSVANCLSNFLSYFWAFDTKANHNKNEDKYKQSGLEYLK